MSVHNVRAQTLLAHTHRELEPRSCRGGVLNIEWPYAEESGGLPTVDPVQGLGCLKGDLVALMFSRLRR
jgi:hypothetical protein